MNMNDDLVSKMLDEQYEIKLRGAEIGYILGLISDQQRILNERMSDNIVNAMAAMQAAANDVVGNSFLWEAYRVAGVKLLAVALNTDESTMKTIMTSKKTTDIRDAVKKVVRPINRGTLN